jgi:hypothetical protein
MLHSAIRLRRPVSGLIVALKAQRGAQCAAPWN